MQDGWSYRKIATPPLSELGRWQLTIEDKGEVMECGDLAPLLKRQVEALTHSHKCTLEWLLW